MQVPILARSSREMSQTVRIDSTFSLRKNVHTMLLPQHYFCYLVLNLVAKVCYHQMKLSSRPAVMLSFGSVVGLGLGFGSVLRLGLVSRLYNLLVILFCKLQLCGSDA